MTTRGYYPQEVEPGYEPVNTTVQLPPDLHRDLKFISELWNAFDDALGIKRRSTWKPASVIRRLLMVGRDGIAETLGGFPEDDESRKAFIKKTAAKVAAESNKSKK